jgi:hypothetical protein
MSRVLLPGQFTVRTLLVLTVQTAFILGTTRAISPDPILFAKVAAVFVGLIGLRFLLFGRRSARDGYILSGMIVGPIAGTCIGIVLAWQNFDARSILPTFILSLVVLLPLGLVFGAAAGGLMAATGLVLEWLLSFFGGGPVLDSWAGDEDEDDDPEPPLESDPHPNDPPFF